MAGENRAASRLPSAWSAWFSRCSAPAERLFQLFDKKNTGVIDYEEFLSGMATCTRGTADERIAFLFNLYDLNGFVLKFRCLLPASLLVPGMFLV